MSPPQLANLRVPWAGTSFRNDVNGRLLRGRGGAVHSDVWSRQVGVDGVQLLVFDQPSIARSADLVVVELPSGVRGVAQAVAFGVVCEIGQSTREAVVKVFVSGGLADRRTPIEHRDGACYWRVVLVEPGVDSSLAEALVGFFSTSRTRSPAPGSANGPRAPLSTRW